MPLQTIRVTPADRKNGKAKHDEKHPQQPQPPHPPPDPPRMDDDDSDPGRRRRSSTLSGFTNSQDICRICHCEASPDLPLISPCWCAGSLRFVHQQCLQQWIKSSDARHCELCKFGFVMRTTLKPFRKWEKLEMSAVERRKVLCSVAFHAVAVTCVVWSLYVLIERTAEEVAAGALEWPFWTKLVVVGVGFSGGVVFMYVQCKMYVQLFRRWRAYNRIIQVQDAPEKRPQQAVFSAAAQLTTQLTSEEKRTSPDEDEFHSCESGGSSSSSSSGSVEGRGLRGLRPPTPTAGAAAQAETCSTKTTLTSVTDSLVPGGGGVAEQQHHQHHPLGEVVVVPSGGEDRQQTTS